MIRRIFTAILAFILGAACAVGGMFVYRKVKSNKAPVSPATATASALYAEQASANPYEDPNDTNTTKDGTCFSTDVMTGYFMEIKLSQQSTGIVHPDYQKNWGDWSGVSYMSDKTHNATAILTFVDMKYNDNPIFVSVYTKVKYTVKSPFHNPRLWCQEDFTEENDNAIRIPASYYNYMMYEMQEHGASLRRFNLTYMKNEGKDVMPLKYTQEINVRLYTKNIPADSDDPTSPNFKLDNWTGIMSAVKNGTGCSSVPAWVWWILGGIGILFVLMLVIRLLRFGFGKR